MVNWKLSAFALVALQALNAFAQVDFVDVEEETTEPSSSPNIAVFVTPSFPGSEVFGVKVVNGNPTQAVLSVTNNEPEPVTFAIVGGALHSVQEPPHQPPINLTSERYNVQIPAGSSESLPYSFKTNLHPQDLRLVLTAIVVDSKGSFYTVPAANQTVSIVEAPTSIFDPQIIFLYLVLSALFAGTVYFIYTTWISTLFPQARRGGKGGERAKRSSLGTKKAVDPADQVAVTGGDGPAVTSGAKYDESWIPVQHLQRPEARRVGSGRSSTPRTKKA